MSTSRDRNLRINLSANSAGLERGFQRAERAMESYRRTTENLNSAIMRAERELQADIDRTTAEVEAKAQARSEAWQAAGRGMVVAGTAIAASMAVASHAAIQWESDWAGVTKVLDGSPEQINLLERSFRDLSLVLPVAHSEIAEVASASAQLGVANEHLIAFTQTAIQLGVATNLSSQDAAMGLARLSTVMGVSFADINKMGSGLVELGNNFAAMEDEILAMSLRLSGMGNQLGLTSGQVMGLAAGMTAVGIQAELGGGAFSRSLGRMQAAVLEGGERLQAFADVAGMSADDFADAFQNRPQEAIVAFLRGLDQVNKSGGSVYTTLADLGLSGTEIADVMGRASAAWETMAEAMEVGNRGFEEGTALLEEAAERFGTTESQVQLAKNSLNELAIDIGNNLLPMVGDAADTFSSWMLLIRSMPEPAQAAVTAVGGIGAAALLAGGAFLVGVPKLAEFRTAMDTMGPRTQALGRGLSNVTSFLAGPWGIALGLGVLALGLWADKKAEAAARTQEFVTALQMDTGEIGANTQQVLANIIAKEDLLTKARQFEISTETLVGAMLGEADAIREVEEALDGQTGAYLRAADGGTAASNRRRRAANDLEDAIFGTNEQLDEAKRLHEAEAEVMGTVERGARDAADAKVGLADAASLVGDTVGGAAGAARDFKAALDELNSSLAESINAELNYNSTLLRATETVNQNAGATDRNTEAGIANHRAILDVISAGEDEIATMIDNKASTEELEKKKKDLRRDLEDLRTTVGLTDDQFGDYDQMLRNVESQVDTAVEVSARGTWTQVSAPAAGGGEYLAYATGGAVHGPGTGTSDSIHALLSNGEHVLTAEEVRMLGGQDSVYAMRQLIRDGSLRFATGGAVEPQRYARGGAVLPAPVRVVRDHEEDTRIRIQQMIEGLTASIAQDAAAKWKRHMESGGSVVSAWKSQLGVPYSWGGGGPGGPSLGFGRGAGIRGFDCSSLMQYGWARAGVSLPRVTYSQINYGRPVPRGQERPGDLVFPHRGHVAGVVGPGRLIHAPYTGATVSYRGMYPNPIAIRRPGRYDQGGRLEHGDTGINLSRRPERVLSPRQTHSFERLVDGLLGTTIPAGRSVDGTPQQISYHVHHVPGFTTERDLHRAEQARQTRVRAGRRG